MPPPCLACGAGSLQDCGREGAARVLHLQRIRCEGGAQCPAPALLSCRALAPLAGRQAGCSAEEAAVAPVVARHDCGLYLVCTTAPQDAFLEYINQLLMTGARVVQRVGLWLKAGRSVWGGGQRRPSEQGWRRSGGLPVPFHLGARTRIGHVFTMKALHRHAACFLPGPLALQPSPPEPSPFSAPPSPSTRPPHPPVAGEVAGLIPKDELDVFLNDVRPIMRQHCPGEQRGSSQGHRAGCVCTPLRRTVGS